MMTTSNRRRYVISDVGDVGGVLIYHHPCEPPVMTTYDSLMNHVLPESASDTHQMTSSSN